MTNEEAIKNIKQLLRWYLKEEPLSETVYKREAVNMAIKALEQQPCEDAISREDTLNKINSLIAEYLPLMPIGWTLPLNIAKMINEMPSVTPQPYKEGEEK